MKSYNGHIMDKKSSRSPIIVMSVSILLGLVVAIAFVKMVAVGGEDPTVSAPISPTRNFTVDYDNDRFLLDGKPFRYISGSFHYFRALPQSWQSRLKTMRAAGLNAIDTYVEWALHNPKENIYSWEGIADIENFIQLAQDEGFYVILRPGPYICAERDNGGLPYWLFTKYPDIKPRTSDANYLHEVSLWYSLLMPKLQKFMYGNGGSIIMVQVENEYGVFNACDKNYLNWLRDETEKYVKGKALLFTTDIPNDRIQCGKIEGVFATTDFGIDRINEIDDIWKTLRSVQTKGPLVNSEFYPGWLTHWQEENQRRDGEVVASALKTILDYGASVNFYMFFGGTNFGFTAGANDWGFGNYTPDITSYDYDAVMDEAGDPTLKYELVRKVILNYLPSSNPEITPEKTAKMAYGPVQVLPTVEILSDIGRRFFTVGAPVKSLSPKTFEELDQFSGLVLYETDLPSFEIDPTLLTIEGLHDRALIYVDQNIVGILSRENKIDSLPLNKGFGTKLQVLVENQGRINFNVADDKKGILGSVSLQKLSGEKQPLLNWTSTSIPLEDSQIRQFLLRHKAEKFSVTKPGNFLRNGPVVFYGVFVVTELGDTYLNTVGWGKGVVFLNGLNLGRYWPLVGPQKTLYVPKDSLRIGTNDLVIIEYQQVPERTTFGLMSVLFQDSPSLDGES